MAEIVRQAEVLKTVIAMLTKEFGYRVYAQEVQEDFIRPCFFVTATSVATPQTLNWLNKELTIQLIYYAEEAAKNEIEYMTVVDRVQMMLPVGLPAGDRFLKIDTIEDARVGEEEDILQITITIPYVERTNYDINGGAALMNDIAMNITHDGGRGQSEVFPGEITPDTV